MSTATLTAAPAASETLHDDLAQRELDERCASLEKLATGRGLEGDELLRHRFHVAAYAAGQNPLTGQPYYTADDFAAEWQRAEDMDAIPSAINGQVIGRLFRVEIVPNGLLRRKVEALVNAPVADDEKVTLETIAEAVPADLKIGDSSYLRRVLGMSPATETSGRRKATAYSYKRLRWYMPYEQACAIARAIGVPFQEVGC